MADKLDDVLKKFWDNLMDVGFDKWFDQYKKNYRTENVGDDEIKPKYEFLPKLPDDNPIYKKCKYWPDKKDLETFVIFFGTEPEIIQYIQQYDLLRSENKSIVNTRGTGISFKWKPQVNLTFRQSKQQANQLGQKTVSYAETGFRLTQDETDLSKSEIATLASNIFSQFKDYKWEKGKVTVSYKDKESGFDNWWNCKTESGGIELITKLLACVGKTIDLKYVFISQAKDPEAAYPSTGKTFRVLGEEYKEDSRKKVIDVVFYKADLFLPRSGQTIQLIYENMLMYRN